MAQLADVCYCLVCNLQYEYGNMRSVFKSGFRRVQNVDYRLGICLHCNLPQQ